MSARKFLVDGLGGHLAILHGRHGQVLAGHAVAAGPDARQAGAAMIVGVDRKRRVINLSVKAKESEEEAAALQEYAAERETAGRTTLGDLLKEQLDSK